jgi:hypothetical protein
MNVDEAEQNLKYFLPALSGTKGRVASRPRER